MQSTNATLFDGVCCALENILLSKYKVQIRYYLLGLFDVLENTTPLSKCKEQMRHYLLGLFYALENTRHPLFQVQRANKTLFTGVVSCFREYPPFQMQSTNATLFAGIILWFREYPPFAFSKCKVQMRHYLLGLFYALENTPFFPNTKGKSDIIYWD